MRFLRSVKIQNLLYAIYTHRKYFVVLLILVGFGVYGSFLAFGEYSLEVLLKDREQKNTLQKEVDLLQAQNAKLQKDLFELKGLEP